MFRLQNAWDVYLRDNGCRDFEKDPNFNSAELNKDIVFFARSLVEIWGKAPRQCMIADMQIPEKNILKFYGNLAWDEWAKVWHRCIFTKFSQRFYLYESLHGIANEYENKG